MINTFALALVGKLTRAIWGCIAFCQPTLYTKTLISCWGDIPVACWIFYVSKKFPVMKELMHRAHFKLGDILVIWLDLSLHERVTLIKELRMLIEHLLETLKHMTDDVTENFCLFLNGLKYLLDFDSNFIASSG